MSARVEWPATSPPPCHSYACVANMKGSDRESISTQPPFPLFLFHFLFVFFSRVPSLPPSTPSLTHTIFCVVGVYLMMQPTAHPHLLFFFLLDFKVSARRTVVVSPPYIAPAFLSLSPPQSHERRGTQHVQQQRATSGSLESEKDRVNTKKKRKEHRRSGMNMLAR